MIVLDTTVLVYALGSEHPLRDPSRRVIEAIGDGSLAATTTVDVIQEFARGYARRRAPQTVAAAHARRYVTLLEPLLMPTERDLDAGLRLFERHERLHAFAAVLAATALEHGAEALVSGIAPSKMCAVCGSSSSGRSGSTTCSRSSE